VVARYLSEAWFEEVAAATPAPSDRGLILQQVITGAPEGEIRYVVTVGAQGASVRAGQDARPDATFTGDYETAAALAEGRLTIDAALLAGRIRIRGNMSVLASEQARLATLDPLPASVRAATTF